MQKSSLDQNQQFKALLPEHKITKIHTNPITQNRSFKQNHRITKIHTKHNRYKQAKKRRRKEKRKPR